MQFQPCLVLSGGRLSRTIPFSSRVIYTVGFLSWTTVSKEPVVWGPECLKGLSKSGHASWAEWGPGYCLVLLLSLKSQVCHVHGKGHQPQFLHVMVLTNLEVLCSLSLAPTSPGVDETHSLNPSSPVPESSSVRNAWDLLCFAGPGLFSRHRTPALVAKSDKPT